MTCSGGQCSADMQIPAGLDQITANKYAAHETGHTYGLDNCRGYPWDSCALLVEMSVMGPQGTTAPGQPLAPTFCDIVSSNYYSGY
jgi:hypothetical protein